MNLAEALEVAWLWLRSHAPIFEKICIVVATVLAAIGSWNSYLATEQATKISDLAYNFSLQNVRDAVELQKPVLTILGGKISHGETTGEGYSKLFRYRIELRIRNSGARDAKPVWIALSDGEASTWEAKEQLANIPKDQEASVFFYMKFNGEHDHIQNLSTLAVALRHIDTAPNYDSASRKTIEVTPNISSKFSISCSDPKIQLLTVHKIKGESGMTEAILSMGRSMSVAEAVPKDRWTPTIEAASQALSMLNGISQSSPDCGHITGS